jgi:AcrR family transcriptional regulator
MSMEKPESPSARRARAALIAAATDLVIAGGVEAVTVREVAERAGYSVASLYNHIDGIPGLLAGARLSIENSLVATLASPGADAPQTVAELAAVFVDYASYFCERPHAFDLLFGSSAAARAAGRGPAVRAGEAELRALWGPTFSGLVAAGELAPDRVERTALRLIYLVHGALLIAVSSAAFNALEVREQVRDAVTWALAAEATHIRSQST